MAVAAPGEGCTAGSCHWPPPSLGVHLLCRCWPLLSPLHPPEPTPPFLPSPPHPSPPLQEVPLIQKLYRLVFLGLTLPDGEAMLVPTLVALLNKCLEAATQQRDPLAYLQLLRVLFRWALVRVWVVWTGLVWRAHGGGGAHTPLHASLRPWDNSCWRLITPHTQTQGTKTTRAHIPDMCSLTPPPAPPNPLSCPLPAPQKNTAQARVQLHAARS